MDRRDARRAVKRHAEALQVRDPWIDPDIVRRSSEQPVENTIRRDQARQQLQLRRADRARAAFLGAHRDQRASDALPEVRLIGARHPRRRDKVPPGDVLVLRQAPLGTTGRDDQDAADEEAHLRDRDPERRQQFHQEEAKLLQVRRTAGQPGDLGLPGARQQHAGSDGKIVVRAAVRPVRDAAHGIRDVPVKTGEEAKAMLAGQRPPRRLAPNSGPGMLRAFPPRTGLRS